MSDKPANHSNDSNLLPVGDPGLNVTENAMKHIRRTLEKAGSPKPDAIRVGVKRAGCSGYEYTLALAHTQQLQPFDLTFNFEDVNVLIDKEIYVKFLKGGTVMDFRKEGINEGLHFDNPNVANQCGCGESFTLVEEVKEVDGS